MKPEQMKILLFLITILIGLPLLATSGNDANSPVKLVNLKVENVSHPIGMDVNQPRFSWQMKTDANKRDYKQIAYRIEVKDENGNTAWNSGKVTTGEATNIYYKGESLRPTTRYNWTVTVWDQTNKPLTSESYFETGFLNPDMSAWNGAQWIGGGDDDLVLYSDYLSVYRLKYTVQIDKKSSSSKASFVFGANDPRLMDRNKNLFEVQNSPDESYILLTLDISPLSTNPLEQARMDIYRVGYHPDDKKDVPFMSFNIPTALINNDNKYQPHNIELEMVYGLFDIYIDGMAAQNKITATDKPGASPFTDGKIHNLNPVGVGGDYLSFPMVAEIGFSMDKGQTAYFSGIEVANFRSPSNALFTENVGNGIFSVSGQQGLQVDDNRYKIGGQATPVIVVADPSRNAAPMLRTTFESPKPEIAKARLYVTARGIYEVYLNGQRIGNDYFNPGLSQYNKTHFYQTYDVTSMINSGKNALGAILSEGWWSGSSTFVGHMWNFFGDRQALLAKLVITYNDGTEKIITTQPDSWQYYNEGPIRYGSFFQGEVYDATREQAINGWNTTQFDDKAWKKAVAQQSEGLHYTNEFDVSLGMVTLNSDDKPQFVGTTGENPQVVDVMTAQNVKEVRKGVFVYDMGQNMVGVPEISVNGKAGDRVTVRYAEILYPDLPDYRQKKGMIMIENLRGALVQDIYVLKGGPEVIQPRFTSHGYRYVEITGIDQALPVSAVKGKVISSIHERTSEYTSSDPLVNRLWQNIVWSSLGNFLSIPTDCPQRNERMGWSGDISVFSKTATYIGNLNQFLDRHLLAMRNTQRSDGRYPDIAPLGGGFGGVLWGSAGITVPWEVYCQYNDVEALRKHYDSMKAYMAYVKTTLDPNTNITKDGMLGDWLSPVNDQNDNSLLFESYYIYELEIMGKVAAILGHNEDADAYKTIREDRKAMFNQKYIDPQTRKTIFSGFVPDNIFGTPYDPADFRKGKIQDTQVSYAVPLALNVINDEYKSDFARNFAQTLTRKNVDDLGNTLPEYSLTTGFIGTAWISNALSENGYDAEAYRLLLNRNYPSWLYPVEQGATTIWERLNSFTVENGFGGNNSMNSFNHYSFGAIGSWMINHSLGIQRDDAFPGFKHFILKPVADPDATLTYAAGHYDSPYGRIASKWIYSDNKDRITYEFDIPANTSATLYLPAKGQINLSDDNTGVIEKGADNNYRIYELSSGMYKFEIGL